MLIPHQIRRPNALAYASTAIGVVVVGIAASAYVYLAVDKTGRAHIENRAQTVAVAVSGDAIDTLSGTEADLVNPRYASLKALLMHMREVNHDVRFAYLVGSHPDGSLYFIADSESPSSSEYSPPGQDYPEATQLMRRVLEAGVSATEGPSRDRWGVWISGYAPVYDSSGHVVALLGLDLPAAEFLTTALAYSLLPLFLTLLLLVLLAAAERMHAREFKAVGQKAEFLSIASHEIRTPLTGIRWAIETVLKGKQHTSIDPEIRDILERVHENCIMLIARVNNLLDVTAFETRGGKILHRSTFAIKSFVEEIVQSLELSAEERDVRVVIDETYDAADTLTADAQTMHHMFFNLIANAIKYTHPHTEVRLTYALERHQHIFRFIDQGPGMSTADQQHIFEGYHRTEEAVRSGQYGSGLGLYLVRKAAEVHGGSVKVASSPGKGACFTLVIPVRTL